MKFEFILRKLFEYINGTPIRETLAERSKFNLDLWNLFIDIGLLGLTYQERIMTLEALQQY